MHSTGRRDAGQVYGDAIGWFWHPSSHDDEKTVLLRCSIAMLRELRKWNMQLESQGEAPVDIGIGLATGDIVAGNIGSPKRMDYTMIGDAESGLGLKAPQKLFC